MIPYLLAGLSILIGGSVHWKRPNTFWQASMYSTLVIVVVSLLFIFFQSNYLSLDENTAETANIGVAVLLVSALVSFFGLLVFFMVGYFLKIVRPSVQKHHKNLNRDKIQLANDRSNIIGWHNRCNYCVDYFYLPI